MSNNNFLEYNLPQNAYASFDAVTLKQVILDRLNTNAVFKDQNFEGSNLSSLIDIIAFSYHVLLFYLNQTSAETTFSQATLYENVNKIIGLLGYNPVGTQTSLVNFEMTASALLPPSIYTIKRFGSINVNGYLYTLINDVNFEKTLADAAEGVTVSNNFLYQGALTEYPTYMAIGEDFETVFVSYDNFVDTNTQKFIADNTFSIFVKESYTDQWYEWEETNSLFDNDGTARVYEKRLNEYGRFEFKFGNDVNGKKLQVGDQVGIYFVYSDGSPGQISENRINGIGLTPFLSTRFNEIVTNIYPVNTNFVLDDQLQFLSFANANKSTTVTVAETVDQLKLNVPKYVSAQNRAVTLQDYSFYVTKNFSAFLASNSVINNTEFVDNYIKYFYDIGLKAPNVDTNVLINQVDFMSATNFNNIYVFVVPKNGAVINGTTPLFTTQSQKQLIVNELDKIKMTSQQIVPMDPVYKAFDFGIALPGETPSYLAKDTTKLVVVRAKNSKQSREKIKNDIAGILINYFATTNVQIGQTVSLLDITNQILGLQGVKTFSTSRTVNGTVYNVDDLSFVYWNPIYPYQDVNFTTQNILLKSFEYPFLYDSSNIFSKIEVIDE